MYQLQRGDSFTASVLNLLHYMWPATTTTVAIVTKRSYVFWEIKSKFVSGVCCNFSLISHHHRFMCDFLFHLNWQCAAHNGVFELPVSPSLKNFTRNPKIKTSKSTHAMCCQKNTSNKRLRHSVSDTLHIWGILRVTWCVPVVTIATVTNRRVISERQYPILC